MTKKILAITTCRVSTPEQEENNSLKRQADAVKLAATELGAIIPADGQWSGNVSSKVGKNVYRKDLKQMLDYCKKYPAVKYLIVHEVDRFMRSIQELFYFEVEFEKVGVKVWYASQPDLNTNDHKAKLFKALEAFKGEASNVERITKSIDGQTDALKEGRFPFSPKPGYKRGYYKGIQEPHDVKAPILKEVLLDIVHRRLEPTDALKKLNASEFMNNGKTHYKMDKFRKIVTDPFYAGVVEIDKQIKYRNENGRHVPLITLEQHYQLLQIMNNKKKYQIGPRKNGNPEYPLSNLVTCAVCVESSRIPRYVGFKHGNGKNASLVYHKYRCRSCRRYITRDNLHSQVTRLFDSYVVTDEGVERLMIALNEVWKQQEAQSRQDALRLIRQIDDTKALISTQAIAAIDPTNISIKQEILSNIAMKKDELAELEDRLLTQKDEMSSDKEKFLRFALDFVGNMSHLFMQLSRDNRQKCKQIIFPAGFYLDKDNKVYTPEISPLYRLATNKRDTEVSRNVNMVRLRESLSSFPAPFARLVRELGEELAVEVESPELVVCEKPGAEGSYRPNRKLQPNEVVELVELYRRGASMMELTRQYGLHRNTVEAHLRRAGVAKRPMVKMTESLVERATRLYVEELWTTARIGKEFGVDASTVAKALKRAGVRMRPPVAGWDGGGESCA